MRRHSLIDAPDVPNIYSRISSAAGLSTLACLLIGIASTPVVAQSIIPDVAPDRAVTVEQIEASVTALQAQEGLDEETRARVSDLLANARVQINNRTSAESAAAEYSSIIETAPAEIERLREELATSTTPVSDAAELGISDATGLPELEQELARQVARLTAAESSLTGLEDELEREDNRPQQARQRIDELRGERDALDQADTETSDEALILQEARRLTAVLRRNALTAEISRLEQEMLSHDLRIRLLNVRRDLAERTLSDQRQLVFVIQGVVNERRQATALLAQQEAELTQLAAANAHPVVSEIAEGNAELTRGLPAITDATERATREVTQIGRQARQIEEDLARSRQRLEIGGVSQITGRLFAEDRRNLPQVSQYRREVRERRDALSDIGLAQLRIDEQRRDLTPISSRIDVAMQAVSQDITDVDNLQAIETDVRRLLQTRRELLDQASRTYTTYLRALGDLDEAQRRLLAAADDYKEFLDQHLLWIPNADILSLDTLRDLPRATAWLVSPSHWQGLSASLIEFCRDDPLLASLGALLIALSFGMARPLGRYFRRINDRVGRLSTDHIGLTLAALGIVALRALPVPLTLGVVGIAVARSPLQSEFVTAASTAILRVAPFLYNVMLYRVLCAHRGVAEIHFDWPEKSLGTARRQLQRMALLGVPVVFATVVFYASPLISYQESAARISFILMMVVLASVIRPLAKMAADDAARPESENDGPSLAQRLKSLGLHIASAAPLLLAGAAAFGYLYTAASLTGHLVDTLWLVLGLIVTKLVVLRWLTLTRRKIAWQLALKKREERRAEAETLGQDEADDHELPTVKRKPIDLETVDQQTRRLLRAGLFFAGIIGAWGIWSEVLPALNVFEQVSLWSRTSTVAGQEVILPVTLADLLLAIVVATVTVVASKNLPGLMEILVLQRLTLQPGSRYAINTLVRYVLVSIGVVTVLGIVGWDWSQIQWLVAALSVGLGFGLQEIVANFVSGLIILFERPVRVGDTVTVGQLTGTVSRLQIRATTITDWDRKEIVVPNKAFITEQVVNWTLSDPITRIVVPVGIAYGSDQKLAHKVMEETLTSLPLVLDDPPPKVYFMGFGDSSLDFNLYVYSRQLADRLPLTHAVHDEILAALRKNGIEIPFPQRDLHLRSVDSPIPVGQPGDGENGDAN